MNAGRATVDWAAGFMTNGAHAQQATPSQHRTRAAVGMFIGWLAGDKLRDYMFGITQKSEGEYVEVKHEDVPLPLRFLHKVVEWDPHSDAPEEQYKKILYQSIPMITAGLGTIAGSMSAFGFAKAGSLGANLGMNSRGKMFEDYIKASKLNPLQADMASHYAQAGTFRALTAGFGGFSAASMLNIVYGMMLNVSFLLANGARAFGFGGGVGMGNFAAHRSAEVLIGGVGNYVKAFKNGDKAMLEEFADTFVHRVLSPLFKIDLKNPAKQAEVRNIIKNHLEKSYELNKHLDTAQVAEAVAEDFKKFVGGAKVDDPNILNHKVLEKMGLDINHITLGGAFPGLREFLEKLGFIGKNKQAEALASKIPGFVGRTASSGYSPAMAGV